MNDELELLVSQEGELHFIYDDRLAAALAELGQRHDRRVSHVDPDQDNPGYWIADMSPLGVDVRLGPFRLRSEALAAELAYLKKVMTGGESCLKAV